MKTSELISLLEKLNTNSTEYNLVRKVYHLQKTNRPVQQQYLREVEAIQSYLSYHENI